MFEVLIGKKIACDLFEGKSVERHILVQGVYHPVAVAPGLSKKKVLVQAIGIGVTREVEPMSSPAFAERDVVE